MLVSPPGLPTLGMEHPMLSIVSPDIITKDNSSLDVIIHEIVHSWTGNTVTCANWRHLWLNEGFTTYIERQASVAVWGREYSREVSYT